SPESGFGESMSVATVYGTTFRPAPCSAHSGIGLLSSLPSTPSKVLPSPGPYRRPSRLSNERFSNSTTTTWSGAPATVRESAMVVCEDVDVSVGGVDADPPAVLDQAGGALDADDRRQTVLPRDHRAVGHQAADLRHEAVDRDEQGRPARVGVGGDED